MTSKINELLIEIVNDEENHINQNNLSNKNKIINSQINDIFCSDSSSSKINKKQHISDEEVNKDAIELASNFINDLLSDQNNNDIIKKIICAYEKKNNYKNDNNDCFYDSISSDDYETIITSNSSSDNYENNSNTEYEELSQTSQNAQNSSNIQENSNNDKIVYKQREEIKKLKQKLSDIKKNLMHNDKENNIVNEQEQAQEQEKEKEQNEENDKKDDIDTENKEKECTKTNLSNSLNSNNLFFIALIGYFSYSYYENNCKTC